MLVRVRRALRLEFGYVGDLKRGPTAETRSRHHGLLVGQMSGIAIRALDRDVLR